MFDVWVMLLFGFLGVVLRKLEFPLAPLALTLIIGPLMENSLRQALSISRGHIDILFRSPLACVLLLCGAAILSVPLWSRRARARGRLGKDATD